MKNISIIIATRLGAKRFPNKPLAKINGVPMIIHVLNRAKESKIGEVFVATPDYEIIQVVKENGGKAILTKKDHPSGSDRIYEAYTKEIKNNVDPVKKIANVLNEKGITLKTVVNNKKEMVSLLKEYSKKVNYKKGDKKFITEVIKKLKRN